jgi:hypothetical protein
VVKATSKIVFNVVKLKLIATMRTVPVDAEIEEETYVVHITARIFRGIIVFDELATPIARQNTTKYRPVRV